MRNTEKSVTMEEAVEALYVLRRYVEQTYVCASHSASGLNWAIGAIHHFIEGKYLEAGRFIAHAEERLQFATERRLLEMAQRADSAMFEEGQK